MAKQPMREAKRIDKQRKKDVALRGVETGSKVDLSDAQVLLVKLIRRDKGIWPPHTDYLKRIELRIIEGMTRAEFEDMAATLMNMVQPLSKEFREAEWELSRTGTLSWHTCLKCNYGWNEVAEGKDCPRCAGHPRKLSSLPEPPSPDPRKPWTKPDHPFKGYDPNDPALESLLDIPDFLRRDYKIKLHAAE